MSYKRVKKVNSRRTDFSLMIQITEIVYIGEPRVGFHDTDGTLGTKTTVKR